MERLQKVIANNGYTSRRKAEELIKKGRVKVNGNIVYELGIKVNPNDEIEIDGNTLVKEDKVYYILNKPRGIITSTKDEKNRKTVVDLINTNSRIYPIGRLDYDTTGIILLTNDGEFANLMMHPKNNIEKTYIVKLKGIIDGYAIKKIKQGVMVDGYKCIPDRVKLKKFDKKTNTCIVEITVHDGRNHEIKKIFESNGYLVEKLKRETFGIITLEGLTVGESRKLTIKEVKQLYAYSKRK